MIVGLIYERETQDAYAYMYKAVKLVVEKIENGTSQASDDIRKILVNVKEECDALFPEDYIPMSREEQWEDYQKRLEEYKKYQG